MTTVAVLADPPDPGVVLQGYETDGDADPSADPLLDPEERVDLYRAMLRDVCLAVEASGADLLVNYRPADLLPVDGIDAETAVRESLAPVLSDPDGARFEVQVGSTRSARIGNTVTHLLEEGARTAAAVDPTAALLARQHVDGAAMKLRQAPVVLGPAPDGRVHYAAFAEPVDFADAFAEAPLRTLVERARAAALDVDLIEMLPVFERPSDLPTALSTLDARRESGMPVPEHTAEVIDDLGVRPIWSEGSARVERT